MAVRAGRVMVGIALMIAVFTLIDYMQNLPPSSSNRDTAADMLMGTLAIALSGAALVAAWFIAVGRGPTSAEEFDRLHARGRRSLEWRNRKSRLLRYYKRLDKRLAPFHPALTRVMPAFLVVFAIAGIYTLGTAPAGADPEKAANGVPALRMSTGMMAADRPLPVAHDTLMVAAQNTPLFLRLDSEMRIPQR